MTTDAATTTAASSRVPDPPFGFGPVRTLTVPGYDREGREKGRQLIAQCDSFLTADVMRAAWDPVARRWGEWYLEF